MFDYSKIHRRLFIALKSHFRRHWRKFPVEPGIIKHGPGFIITYPKWFIFVERGTRPHTPPLKAIKRWAAREGVSAGAVWQKIRREGTRPSRYAKRGLFEKIDDVVESVLIDEIGKQIKVKFKGL